jgi:diaminopimelate decarboxylase
MDAGAYFVPFSTSFSYPRPAIVLVDQGAATLIRRRETFDDLVLRDQPAVDA